MHKTLLAILVLIFCSVAQASETSHREAVEKMLEATKVEKNLTNIYAQMGAMVEQQFKEMDVPEDAAPLLVKYQNKHINVMKEELSWQKLKDVIASAYMKVYSEDEVKEITKFYTSPVGAKFIDKLPELTQEMLKAVQGRIPMLVDRYQQIDDEMSDEIAKFEKSKQKAP